jgi:hypothetical protein
MGRPSTFTQEIADEICARVMESDYGLEEICEADDLPSARTVFRWLAAHESFRQQYARAKEAQGHVQADRGLKDALRGSGLRPSWRRSSTATSWSWAAV